MSKTQLIFQIEELTKELQIKSGNSLRYKQAYDVLKEFWDGAIEVDMYIPKKTIKEVNKKLRGLLIDS